MHSNAHSLERVPKNSTSACKILLSVTEFKIFQCDSETSQFTDLGLNSMSVNNHTFDIGQLCIMLQPKIATLVCSKRERFRSLYVLCWHKFE
jgi:hypothetical protein